MKRKLFLTEILVLLILSNTIAWADDFTVKIGKTDDFSGYLPPLKAGGSLQFQIEVWNNLNDTCIVSIDQNSFGVLQGWIAIDNNSMKLFPAQLKNFLLTVTVPTGTTEGQYTLPLYFDAKDSYQNNHLFNYQQQTIIVDNSNPQIPTFSTTKTSKTIYVYSWTSFDAMSSIYTTVNDTSGILGIKSYSVTIKNPDGSIQDTKSFNAKGSSSYTFGNLISNRNYKVNVTATDLVGNTNFKEVVVTTAPAAPANLSFSNTSYLSTTLTWAASAGATGYDVYRWNGSSNTKLNGSPCNG
jgi:hypothetical protein